jgi:hypothetical protein
MRSARGAAFALLLLIYIACIGASAGTAWYLRSEAYRNDCANRLTDALDMESQIGRVRPHSWTARDFENVEVWLPQRRALAAHVDLARYAYLKPRTPAGDYELMLQGGRCEISARTWLRRDVRYVVESSLEAGFSPDGPRRVLFRDFDIRLERDRLAAALTHAAGTVEFAEGQKSARAAAVCREFNGHFTDDPVSLAAEFSPRTGGGIRIDSLKLTVPALPLRTLGIESLAGMRLHSGTFSGRLEYMEQETGRCVVLAGECRDLSLAELTRPFLSRPMRGECPQIQLTELSLNDRIPERLSFSGRLTGLRLGDLLQFWGGPPLEADLELDVREAQFSREGIERFVARGHSAGVSLRALSSWIGAGAMSGRATLRIHDLTIVDSRLVNLEARLEVDPDADEACWISNELARAAAKFAPQVTLPPVLPERIGYARLGVEMKVDDETLYILGTHGERNRAVLTLAPPWGLVLPPISEPKAPITLGQWLDPAREEGRRWLERGLALWREQAEALDAAAADEREGS